MRTHRSIWGITAALGAGVLLLTVGAAGATPLSQPVGGLALAELSRPAAAPPDPIVGQWSYQGGVVEVTGSGDSYAGRVVQATSFNNCVHPVGQQLWTIRGSGGSYSGTHIGFNLADCSDLRMSANFTVSGDAGSYSLTVCADAGCATLHRAVPVDTSPPTVAVGAPTKIIGLGKKFTMTYAVADDSGQAKVDAVLYSGGTPIYNESTGDFVAADAKVHKGTLGPISGSPGPFYICLSATDPAGNTSANAPNSACAWMSIQVSVPLVSNGCGGAQYGAAAESLQNWLLDTKVYGGETVNFRAACNQHDAGYAGATVADPFLKRVVDFRTWSRKQVDDKFREDLATLCRKYLSRSVSKLDRFRCTDGLGLDQIVLTELALKSPGARAYYEGVRAYAKDAFDTNMTIPGVQTDSMPTTNPPGGGRDNA
jgi:hypothetical protein